IVTLLSCTQPIFGFGDRDVWTMFHSEAFDFAVWEIFGCHASGGRLVIVDHLTARDPYAFLRLLGREQVTILNQTPTAFWQLDDAERSRDVDLALRLVIFGGEKLQPANLESWLWRHGHNEPALANIYGITESTVHATLFPIEGDVLALKTSSPIGTALPGVG
ncbi:AMP-binding protein, partial [Nocardia sp. R7R-8]|uniref:AMP-binding protein n=1 Tax=Nocardia sp. R7R-8 TaxID=3459304 RepID=UPI00403D7F2E